MCYGLDTVETRRLAFELAQHNGPKIPLFWLEKKIAGIDWLYSFRDRHPCLSLRQPEPYAKKKQKKRRCRDEPNDKVDRNIQLYIISNKFIVVTGFCKFCVGQILFLSSQAITLDERKAGVIWISELTGKNRHFHVSDAPLSSVLTIHLAKELFAGFPMITTGHMMYYQINNGDVIMIDNGPPQPTFCVEQLRRFVEHVKNKGWIYIAVTVALSIILVCSVTIYKYEKRDEFSHAGPNVLAEDSKFETPSSTDAFSVNSGNSEKPNGNHGDEMPSTLKGDDDNVDAIPTTLIPETKDDEESRTLHLNYFPSLRMHDQNDPNESSPVPHTLRMHDQNDPNESSPVPHTLRMHDQNDPKELFSVYIATRIRELLNILGFSDEKKETPKHDYSKSGDKLYFSKEKNHSSNLNGIGEANLTSLMKKMYKLG
uniref:(California timema) hypothetical protein n=1 Tax=Timema californicum TaxID=61474 RepID=A0A7R9PC28_TIMCA|nr:unnamed protein product [Timema californicum]